MKNFVKGLLSKHVNTTNILVYVGLLFLVFPVLNSCSVYRIEQLKNKSYKEWKTYQWKEIKRSSDNEVNEWIIYSRKVKETNFLEYKIEGEIASSPIVCVSAFRQDIEHQANDRENKKYPTYNIVNESVDSILTYVIYDEPFPFKDTEMRNKYLFFSNEDGSRGVRWTDAWDESQIQLSKKLNRVETFRGSWNFTSITHYTSVAVYSVQFDPKKMPLCLAEPMVNNLLVDGLENMRKMTSK